MNTQRSLPWFLPLCLAWLFACSTTPKPSPAPVTRGGFERAPVYDAATPRAGTRLHVAALDPARSNLGPRLAQALADELAARGYQSVASPEDADVRCELVIRYFGRTAPPDGHLEVLAAAGADPIQGGDEGWLATNGSGFDTVSRKPKTIRFKSRARGWFFELLKGREDDEWVIVVDVAIGARRADQPEYLQRHEGRAWATTLDYEIDRAAAATLVLGELRSQLPAAFP